MDRRSLTRLSVVPCLVAMQLLAATDRGFAGDLKIPLPRHRVSTPSQTLNRDGVAELKRGHQEKAKRLFYRAYLLDPDDPFTLNNLGYIAELEGDADQALRFYALAARDPTQAIIAESSETALQGKPLAQAFHQVQDSEQKIGDFEINRINEQAITLLQKGRVLEAGNLLKTELPRHPRDPFLLNNLGYAMECVGDIEGALRYYSAAASVHSTEPIVLTPRLKWRGRAISEVAKENATALSEQIARGEGVEAATARLNLRGVAALNANNPAAAREFFLKAYQEDPRNAFTLNNLGYLAELAGDRETADMYYDAARSGQEANDRVSYATRPDAEGRRIDNLADHNESDVESTLRAIQEAKRQAPRPIELKRRAAASGSNAEANSATNSGSREERATPVPPIAVPPPALPALPPPQPDEDRNATQPENPPPQQQ